MKQSKFGEKNEVRNGRRNKPDQERKQNSRQQEFLRVIPNPVQVSAKITE